MKLQRQTFYHPSACSEPCYDARGLYQVKQCKRSFFHEGAGCSLYATIMFIIIIIIIIFNFLAHQHKI